MSSTIFFHGGAGAVTGSNFLLELDSPSTSLGTTKIRILVDCGLRQGIGEEINWEEFPYAPGDISHLVVTHAHLDHIGLIPKLVKDGFKGTIISTKATKTLVEPLLLDALEILERAAQHRQRPPLYAEEDISHALRLWQGVGYHEKISLPGGVELELLDAGHILGSAMARFTRADKSIVFTGDLGGGNSPLLRPAEAVAPTYLVVESTYGDRTRPDDAERVDKLEDTIEDAIGRGGTLIIPAFSTERTQDLLFDIGRLMREGRVPKVPVYLDSPLAETITHAYLVHPEYFADDIAARVGGGENIFAFPELRFVKTPDESRRLDEDPAQKIILAGSGMSSGGRVLSHERRYLPDEKNSVLIVGFQAIGTIGRKLIEGENPLKLQHEEIAVRAKVEQLYGYSAHRDAEGLLEFINQAGRMKEVFLVHGEPHASMFLAQRVRDYLGVKATVPDADDSAVIDF